MRCKKHYADLSSAIGVCASCLRERLLSVIAAQPQIQNFDGKHRDSDEYPAVYPHFNSRKSDRSDGTAARSDETVRDKCRPYHHSLSGQLIYRTPEVGPATGGHNTGSNSKNKLKSFIRLLSFPNIFRSRNRKPEDIVSDPKESDSTFRDSRGGTNATSSSWFTSIISGSRHRRKQITECTYESTVTGPVRRPHCSDRGMSPVRNSDENESTESWRNTPRRTPVNPAVRRAGSAGHVRNMSGLKFCLSPLVRTSPNLQWNQKGLGLPPDAVFSGEIGAPVKAHLSNTKSFCANRSRKLVDFGRPNPNR